MLRLCLYPAWIDVLGACLGCAHMPRSTRDVPMRWGSRTGCSCRAAVHTPNPGVTLCTKESISFHFGAQPQLLLALPACAQHQCLSALTGTFAYLQRGTVTTPAHRTVSKKVFAESTEDEFGFWLASWSQSFTNSPWYRGSPTFPFHSCLERQAGRFL